MLVGGELALRAALESTAKGHLARLGGLIVDFLYTA